MARPWPLAVVIRGRIDLVLTSATVGSCCTRSKAVILGKSEGKLQKGALQSGRMVRRLTVFKAQPMISIPRTLRATHDQQPPSHSHSNSRTLILTPPSATHSSNLRTPTWCSGHTSATTIRSPCLIRCNSLLELSCPRRQVQICYQFLSFPFPSSPGAPTSHSSHTAPMAPQSLHHFSF
eukprot:1159118-Pelagomonas_calceolata.AAC.1